MNIEDLFTYHDAKHIDPIRFSSIRDSAKDLAYLIMKHGGSLADKERAILKLRESVYYAIASIAIPERGN